MKRVTQHQPIYLSKLKKRQKENTPALVKSHNQKEGIQYDILLFQESLEFENHDGKQLSIKPQRQVTKRQPLGECTNMMNNEGMRATVGNYVKFQSIDSQLKQLGTTTPVMTRMELNKSFREMKSVHKTSASYKPNISSVSVSKIQKSCGEANVAQFKFKQGKFSGEERQSFKQSKNDYNIQLMKKAYEIKIEELANQKINLEVKVGQLQTKHDDQEQEKVKILERMDQLEKEVSKLWQERSQIDNIQTQTIQEIIQKQQIAIQTETSLPQQLPQKQAEQTSQSINQAPRTSIQLANQDWCIKAKSLKTDLEWQKLHSQNMTTEFKINLQNKQIEWSQKYDLLQKQFNTLKDNYSSKCIEVRDKENLLSRFLQPK